MRRWALAASAAGLLLSGWAGVLDPGTASADPPWWPGEPPATPCDHEGLEPGTPCVESVRHVRRSHTYVFDASIWDSYLHELVCHQPPYIDPVGPGTGGLYDFDGFLIGTIEAEFEKTAVIEARDHTVPAAPATVQDWEVVENQSFWGDSCALTNGELLPGGVLQRLAVEPARVPSWCGSGARLRRSSAGVASGPALGRGRGAHSDIRPDPYRLLPGPSPRMTPRGGSPLRPTAARRSIG